MRIRVEAATDRNRCRRVTRTPTQTSGQRGSPAIARNVEWLHLPLLAGTTTDTWFAALEAACQRVSSHGADALVVSLGLDTYAGDPISTFALHSPDFLRLGQRLRDLGLPTALILKGGYAARELGVNAANVLSGFEQPSAKP